MKTAKVIFYLKPEKAKSETGEQPIYCRITVNGKRSNISIKRWVHPDRWADTDKLQKAKKKEDKELIFYMETIRITIREIEGELFDNKIPITSVNIKNSYHGTDKKSKSLFEVFEWHDKEFQELVKREERSSNTLTRYKCVSNHLKNFIKLYYT
ncbi:MAG: Arm DNA-binding domain-containing protein [Bacteroidia bacterium]